MSDEQVWVVQVTYGTWQTPQWYARTKDYKSAEKLCEAALERGYKDAKIVTEADFQATVNTARRSPTSTPATHRRAS